MSSKYEVEGCIGGLVVVALIALAVVAVATAGSVFGAGKALQNYWLAFRAKVRPERATV